MAVSCVAHMGYARFSQYTDVLSKNPLADRGEQDTPTPSKAWGWGATKGQMPLVTFRERKVTRARDPQGCGKCRGRQDAESDRRNARLYRGSDTI